ncbi:hypothetical protein A3762_05180 [Oleiphilus sp. HI0125]|uniref:malonyl-ACP O-methyltransferase BioC n=2 Tax=Oleiphilus sp. HI0125 TaxID=1822266 RepID=UPI0007C3B5FD|nr:malonyl-ACP O-methyltransferase BioC [Oleiphilus sp. HI0125]KZZ59359.1 hypothetical protein A3762_05180 [Oleiphilus sp. HI0125]
MSNQNVASKSELANSFGKAAQNYDASAYLQKMVGNQLIEHTLACDVSFPQGLGGDLGCGTGYFSSDVKTKFQLAEMLLLDISESMARYAFSRWSEEALVDEPTSTRAFYPLVLDAENIALQSEVLDFCFSSLALQWVNDLKTALKQAHAALKPGGVISYSTLVDGTLDELKTSWSRVDDATHVNEFMTYRACLNAALELGYEVLVDEQSPIVVEYQRPMDLMKDLKAIGAHNISRGRSKGLAGKGKLKRVLQAYEDFRHPEGHYPATYQVAYFVLKKKR